jgi:hypothetical protein
LKEQLKTFCGKVFFGRTASNRFAERCSSEEQFKTFCGKPFFKKNSSKQFAGSRSSKKNSLKQFARSRSSKKTAQNILRRGVFPEYSLKHFAGRCSSEE